MAVTAKELLNDIHTHDLAKSAVHMLDWCDGYAEYEIGGTLTSISYDQVLDALRMNRKPPRTATDVYIRDCFDWFFYRVDRIQHYIDRGLIDFQDVKSVFQPYAREIEKHEQVFEEFFDFHEYASAKKFFSQYYSGTHPHVSAREKSTTRGSAGTAAGA